MSYKNYEMRIADLEEQIAELEKLLHESAQTLQDMVDGNMALMTRNKKYREALEFYADPLQYNKHCKKGPLVDDLRVVQAADCETLGDDMGYKLIGAGKRARQALNK